MGNYAKTGYKRNKQASEHKNQTGEMTTGDIINDKHEEGEAFHEVRGGGRLGG